MRRGWISLGRTPGLVVFYICVSGVHGRLPRVFYNYMTRRTVSGRVQRASARKESASDENQDRQASAVAILTQVVHPSERVVPVAVSLEDGGIGESFGTLLNLDLSASVVAPRPLLIVRVGPDVVRGTQMMMSPGRRPQEQKRRDGSGVEEESLGSIYSESRFETLWVPCPLTGSSLSFTVTTRRVEVVIFGRAPMKGE